MSWENLGQVGMARDGCRAPRRDGHSIIEILRGSSSPLYSHEKTVCYEL
jgi:hypothetical protein